MSNKKKQIRENFRNAVFQRDGHTCAIAGCDVKVSLDAHHITDRNAMPNGGYVKENGISLCSLHHLFAEEYHSGGQAVTGFHPEDLYKIIGSSYAAAVVASRKLK